MDGERGRSGVGGNGSGRREHTHKRRRLLQNTDTHQAPTHTPMHQAVLGYILPVASPKTWPDISITAVHSKHIHTNTHTHACAPTHQSNRLYVQAHILSIASLKKMTSSHSEGCTANAHLPMQHVALAYVAPVASSKV